MLMRSVSLCLVIFAAACVPLESPPADEPESAPAAAPKPSSPAYPATPASNAGGGGSGGGGSGGGGSSGGSGGGRWQQWRPVGVTMFWRHRFSFKAASGVAKRIVTLDGLIIPALVVATTGTGPRFGAIRRYAHHTATARRGAWPSGAQHQSRRTGNPALRAGHWQWRLRPCAIAAECNRGCPSRKQAVAAKRVRGSGIPEPRPARGFEAALRRLIVDTGKGSDIVIYLMPVMAYR